ncbi:MAG: hypothetical protein ABIJ45_09380 [Candidatus Zixiibacteriota bacterium]
MRVFNLIIALLLLVCIDQVRSQNIVMEPSNALLEKKLQSYIKMNRNNIDIDSLHNFMINLGYFDNQVLLESKNEKDYINIKPGNQFNFRHLILTGDMNDTLSFPRTVNNENYSGFLNSVLSEKRNEGYYFASLNLTEITKDNASVDLHYNMQLGPAVTISSIEYLGLKRTDKEFISRYNRIRIGDTLILPRIDAGLSAIERAGFIAVNGEPKIIPDPGLNTATLSYQFREIRQFYIEGAGGYIPEDNGYFVWYLNLKGNNIFGGGQNAGLMIDQREKDRSILSAHYSQPLFLISIGEIQIDLFTRDFRKQFYEFGLNSLYKFYANNNLLLNTRLGWKNVEPSDSLDRSYTDYLAGIGVAVGGIKDIKRRDSYLIDWNIVYSSRNYAPSEDSSLGRSVYNDTKNELTIAGQYSLGLFLSNFHRLVLTDLETSEKAIPYSELFLIGGPNSLRGYRNDQFAVFRSIILSTETKYFFGSGDYIYPFIDFAYFWQLDLNYHENTSKKLGYGIGFSLFSNERSFKIELSWAKGTAFDQPRVHARIVVRF